MKFITEMMNESFDLTRQTWILLTSYIRYFYHEIIGTQRCDTLSLVSQFSQFSQFIWNLIKIPKRDVMLYGRVPSVVLIFRFIHICETLLRLEREPRINWISFIAMCKQMGLESDEWAANNDTLKCILTFLSRQQFLVLVRCWNLLLLFVCHIRFDEWKENSLGFQFYHRQTIHEEHKLCSLFSFILCGKHADDILLGGGVVDSLEIKNSWRRITTELTSNQQRKWNFAEMKWNQKQREKNRKSKNSENPRKYPN